MSVEHDRFETELISNLVHDLKTPLSAVKGFIGLIQASGTLNEKQTYFVEKAFSGIKRMELMIANLLDFARIESDIPLDIADVDVPRLIQDSLSMIEEAASGRAIQVRVDIDPQLKSIKGDARLLGHVLTNLLSNAVKYNRDNGNIWVTVSDEEQYVRFDVRDTGIGIPIEAQSRVFERFFRVKQGRGQRVDGNGLGLAIAQSIIRKHGGHIWLESTPSEGSTFSFILPHENYTLSAILPIAKQTKTYEAVYQGPSEPIDDVDDNWQESREKGEHDSDDSHML